jgi:hypothetical protein
MWVIGLDSVSHVARVKVYYKFGNLTPMCSCPCLYVPTGIYQAPRYPCLVRIVCSGIPEFKFCLHKLPTWRMYFACWQLDT